MSAYVVFLVAGLAQGAPASGTYLDLARRYASGDRTGAVAALGQWTDQAVAQEMDGLPSLVATARRCPQRREACELPLLLRAVVLLHLERHELGRRVASDSGRSTCGWRDETGRAGRALGLIKDEAWARGFARRAYLFLALRALGDSCLDDAHQWAQAGIAGAPKDPELLLAAGTIAESNAVWASGPQVGRGDLSPRDRERALRASFGRRNLLEDAGRLFERALVADPDLAEARLHLGRIHFRLERGDAARAAFEAVLGESREPEIAFLAHLFLGGLHEASGRLADAEEEYRAALFLHREAQSAAVALVHVLELRGEAEAGQEVLEKALARAGTRRAPDPLWSYPLGRAGEVSERLDDLRAEASR